MGPAWIAFEICQCKLWTSSIKNFSKNSIKPFLHNVACNSSWFPFISTFSRSYPVFKAIMATEISPEQCVHIFFVTVSAIPMVLSGYFVLKNVLFLGGQKPDCTDPHSGWDLALGLFLFTLFLVGTLSLAWRVTALQMACMALLVLTMALIGGVSRNVLFGGNEPKDSKKIEEYYRLETYPSWAQKFLLKDDDWHAFQNCIIQRKVCDKEGLFQVLLISLSFNSIWNWRPRFLRGNHCSSICESFCAQIISSIAYLRPICAKIFCRPFWNHKFLDWL